MRMEPGDKSQVIMDVEMINADGILDSLLSERAKEDWENDREGRRAWVFMTALEAALRQARSRSELTYRWGQRFWSGKPILGPFKMNFDKGIVDIKYGLNAWEHLRCGVRGSRFVLEVWSEPFLRNESSWPHPASGAHGVKSVSGAFSIIMSYLIVAQNRVPQK
jgi:hypothetical protein